jgi:hypothetical protein
MREWCFGGAQAACLQFTAASREQFSRQVADRYRLAACHPQSGDAKQFVENASQLKFTTRG